MVHLEIHAVLFINNIDLFSKNATVFTGNTLMTLNKILITFQVCSLLKAV